MAENKIEFLKTNQVTITGKLVEAIVKTGFDKNNKAYASVDATVSCMLNGQANVFEINFYSKEMTAKNEVSKLYTSYTKMPELKGRKVEISAEISENRFWSANLGQIASSQKLVGKFIKGVLETEPDKALFEVGGFIAKEVVEKVNKNNEIYRYDLVLGQANYNNTGMRGITLNIAPTDRELVAGAKTYATGMTVFVKGRLESIEQQVTVEDENSGFGEKIVRVYTNKLKGFYITGGSKPITDPEKGAYDMNTIKGLIDAYKAKDIELMNAAATDNENEAVEKAAPVTTRQTSLI